MLEKIYLISNPTFHFQRKCVLKIICMRFLLKITPNPELFGQMVRDGSASQKMQTILGELKPEAAYFTETHGKRTAFLVVDINEASQIPAIAEPWFLQFGSEFEFHPVMLGEDLMKANLEELGKKWK